MAAILTSSGQAASFFAVFNICEAGDHIVSAAAIYGGTYNLFAVTFRKMGIEVTFVDQDAPAEEIAKAFRPNTKAFFAETISNPTLCVLDIRKMADIAMRTAFPSLWTIPLPLPLIAVRLNGARISSPIPPPSTWTAMPPAVGGVIVDSGNFDWEAHKDQFPGLTEPDPSYHGLSYSKSFGKGAYITKATVQLMRDLGSIQSPQNAFLLNLGLETLHLLRAAAL